MSTKIGGVDEAGRGAQGRSRCRRRPGIGRSAALPIVAAALALGIASGARAERALDPLDGDFAAADAHFKADRLREAADAFRSIALAASDRPIGVSAANRFVDAESGLLRSGAEAPSALRAKLPKLIELYCEPNLKKRQGSTCELLIKVECSVVRLEAEGRIKIVDNRGDDAADAAKEAGDIYMSLWTSRGAGPVRAGKAPECSALDEVLYNAARAYQAAGMLPQATAARTILIENQLALGRTPLASRAMYENGGSAQAIGEYAEAAAWYERFARADPKSDRAPDAAVDAIILRLALGQAKEANDDAALFSKVYGAKRPESAASVALAIGLDRIEKGDFKAALSQLQSSQPIIERGSIDVRFRGAAALAQALARTGDAAGAEKQYRGLIAMHSDAIARPSRESGLFAVELRRLGQALTAVGEAYFFVAELERTKAMAEPIPPYKGPADTQMIGTFMTSTRAPALAKRTAAIEAAERSYKLILNMQPAPPPKWVVAAASEVAGMWIATYQQAKVIEITAPPTDTSEPAKGSQATAEEAVAPLLYRAKAAAKACLDFSVKYQYVSEKGDQCAAWLSRRFSKEFPRIYELAPPLRFSPEGGGRGAPAGASRRAERAGPSD